MLNFTYIQKIVVTISSVSNYLNLFKNIVGWCVPKWIIEWDTFLQYSSLW